MMSDGDCKVRIENVEKDGGKHEMISEYFWMRCAKDSEIYFVKDYEM